VKEGFLEIKQSGGKLPKKWKKYYVMLKADGIYYYKEKKVTSLNSKLVFSSF
jgi:hypothetical protein